MKTLVLVEHDNGQVKDATLAAVTAASKLGEVHLLVAGQNVGGVAVSYRGKRPVDVPDQVANLWVSWAFWPRWEVVRSDAPASW